MWLTRARPGQSLGCCSALAVAASVSVGAFTLFPTQTRWTLALNSQLSARPAFDEANAYFALAGDLVVSYDLATGGQRWQTTAHPQFDLAVGDGLLFLAEAGRITALRAADGTVAWRSPIAEPLRVAPVWDNGWLVLATAQGAVLALRATDGELIWQRALRAAAHGPPALAADRIYVPTDDGHVVALRVESGEPLWDRRLGGTPAEILALDDRLYVGAADNYFYCLNADGTVGWRFRAGADVLGLPAIDARNVYFVSLDNVLRALSRRSGVQQWIRPLPVRPLAGPVRAGDTLVVPSITSLRGYNPKDGAAAGEMPVDGELATPPAVVSSPTVPLPMLLVVTRDIAKGATALLLRRDMEPAVQPIAPLPNLLVVAKPTPAPAAPGPALPRPPR